MRNFSLIVEDVIGKEMKTLVMEISFMIANKRVFIVNLPSMAFHLENHFLLSLVVCIWSYCVAIEKKLNAVESNFSFHLDWMIDSYGIKCNNLNIVN
jgi:hypothetical protein